MVSASSEKQSSGEDDIAWALFLIVLQNSGSAFLPRIEKKSLIFVFELNATFK